MLTRNEKPRCLRLRRKARWLTAVLGLTVVAGYAAVHTTFPPPPNAIFYAAVGPGPYVLHDSEWVAIPFYTSPGCVPAGFNLLNFFDFGSTCPLTVHGLAIWKNGPPPIDLAPIQNILDGNGAVQMWFIRWTELQAGIADGVLTVPELKAMPSLKTGSASLYHEVVHPPDAAQVGLD